MVAIPLTPYRVGWPDNHAKPANVCKASKGIGSMWGISPHGYRTKVRCAETLGLIFYC